MGIIGGRDRLIVFRNRPGYPHGIAAWVRHDARTENGAAVAPGPDAWWKIRLLIIQVALLYLTWRDSQKLQRARDKTRFLLGACEARLGRIGRDQEFTPQARPQEL